MRYAEFLERSHFSKLDLIAHSQGSLIEDPPSNDMGSLPAPPFLMFDRITQISRNGSTGTIIAEQDIAVDNWYFQCHFKNDPVQPGCLGLDAVWQLIGFYCIANGAIGSGRALGCGEVDFSGQIRPYDKKVRYEVTIRRYQALKSNGSAIALGDAKVFVDDAQIYSIKSARVGCFLDIGYRDFPNPDGKNARGGVIQR